MSRSARTRYWDRRRYIRVPASGPARWQSENVSGHCEVVDISPGGLGIRMTAFKASQLGATIDVEIETAPGERWFLAKQARIVLRTPDQDGLCHVGVQLVPPAHLT